MGRRILVVSNLFPPHVVGGAEVVAFRHAQELRARGYFVSVFTGWAAPAHQAGRLEAEIEDGLCVWRVPLTSFDPADNFFAPAIGRRLDAVLSAERPDVVHFHNLAGLGFSLIPVVKNRGLAVVVTLHDHAGYCYRATALRPDGSTCRAPEECAIACCGSIQPRAPAIALPMRLRRDYIAWTLALADRLISPSRALAESYRVAGVAEPARTAVISNGIDLAPFLASSRNAGNGRLRFLCVAYLGEHKGIPDLLDAAAQLERAPELAGRWSLAIAGDGHLRANVEAAIASGRVGPAVSYLGRVARERVVAELQAADVLVHPSRWPENEPVVLLEAIAAGVAHLATDVGGVPGIVQPGITGELVPAGDSAALACAMAEYVREPERARRQGLANLARRERFSELKSVDALENLYEEVLREQRPPDRGRPLVLCAGGWPLVQVAEVCNNLYRLEEPLPGVRLVWNAWADAEMWSRAALLWNWSSGADLPVVQRALRAGVPVLAPESCTVARGIETAYGAALTYGTFLECMVALARLPYDRARLQGLRQNCREAAEVLAAGAPRHCYDLSGQAAV